jgi:hypothetical protein
MSSYTNKYSSIVKDLLLQRVDLTHKTMIDNNHGWRLAAVIFYLRGKGWPIETVIDSRRIGHYCLPAGWTGLLMRLKDMRAATPKRRTWGTAMFNKNLNVDYIKHSLNPFDFYTHELPSAKLKNHAWNDGGLCPFHSDNKAGSFRVNLTTGAFKCFACDAKGGDIISFTMTLNGLGFIDSLTKLADEWGLS